MASDRTDGIIKYRNQRVMGCVPSSPELAQLNRARTTLFDLGLIGVDANGIGYGNVSLRADGNQFLITGSATGGLRQLQTQHYCVVESFSVEDNTVRSRGTLDASSESMTHGSIYLADPRVRCVMHIHSRVLFDALLEQHALQTPSDVAYGTPEMANAVVQLVVGQPSLPVLFVMAGHDQGLVAYGTDVESVCALLVQTFHRNNSHDQDRHHRR